MKKTTNFFNKSFKLHGEYSQRRYPNEELCRFMGRNYFHLDKKLRKNINFLEVGCGNGVHLNIINKEGFNAYGIDISDEAINTSKKFLKNNNSKAILKQGNMTNIDFNENKFDCIIDVFSSYCLNNTEGNIFIKEVNRCLKNNGKFFTVFPSKKSDAWKKEKKINLIDKDTLKNFKRKSNPYFNNQYPFRFLSKNEYENLLKLNNFEISYSESLIKSYNFQSEFFEFLIIEAKVNK